MTEIKILRNPLLIIRIPALSVYSLLSYSPLFFLPAVQSLITQHQTSILTIIEYIVLYTNHPENSDNFWIMDSTKGNQNSIDVQNLSKGSTYYFKVQARNSKGYMPLLLSCLLSLLLFLYYSILLLFSIILVLLYIIIVSLLLFFFYSLVSLLLSKLSRCRLWTFFFYYLVVSS